MGAGATKAKIEQCCEDQDAEGLRKILRKHPDAFDTTLDDDGNKVLHLATDFACKYANEDGSVDVSCMQVVIEEVANVAVFSSRNGEGQTPLEMARDQGNQRVIQFLVEAEEAFKQMEVKEKEK